MAFWRPSRQRTATGPPGSSTKLYAPVLMRGCTKDEFPQKSSFHFVVFDERFCASHVVLGSALRYRLLSRAPQTSNRPRTTSGVSQKMVSQCCTKVSPFSNGRRYSWITFNLLIQLYHILLHNGGNLEDFIFLCFFIIFLFLIEIII